MFAVFGMTPARAASRDDVREMDVGARRQKRIQQILDGKSVERLSEVFSSMATAREYHDLAIRWGGVRIVIKQRVADGEPFICQRRKAMVQKFKWVAVEAVIEGGNQEESANADRV